MKTNCYFHRMALSAVFIALCCQLQAYAGFTFNTNHFLPPENYHWSFTQSWISSSVSQHVTSPQTQEAQIPMVNDGINVLPNPFTTETQIAYTCKTNSNVYIAVYDAIGRKVVDLVNGIQNAGVHNAAFNAGKLHAGMYFVRYISSNENIDTFIVNEIKE